MAAVAALPAVLVAAAAVVVVVVAFEDAEAVVAFEDAVVAAVDVAAAFEDAVVAVVAAVDVAAAFEVAAARVDVVAVANVEGVETSDTKKKHTQNHKNCSHFFVVATPDRSTHANDTYTHI